ncbi:putative GntR family transcriptional regulator [Sphingomonas changbaiensis NBRC 104936]|uniref:Putative GntR family transcriptional regulator n=1 Tax=Sphingomonas changbaiensis NBRC 104936 TaxID=1219043 RepID=A0A0E9MPU9_9SPHN|nr:GntR family transcriptional regulator [Sphingomonas changbaiensis]GAO39807.1 putative GntR family transcriptional regulator [Sphingomonas changbaiensis NBRC 104936]
MSLVIRTLSDQLVDLVRNRILSGAVSTEQAIRQDALAAELGVSKIPLREALARLEEEGLIRSQANRGFFVAPLSTSEAKEVYELRIKLEPEATALAAELATEADHAHAVETLNTLYNVTDERGDGVGAFNRAFHRALFRPCGKPITVNILERLQVLSERYVRMHLEPLGRDERANEEHRELLQAWLARDIGRVADLVHAHIGKTIEDLHLQLVEE